MTGTRDIRRAFVDYFARRDHQTIASGALVPEADPTLLFVNSGMVPFKGIFTGTEPRPDPPRAVSVQRCLRAGGKHNDLDNVGYTARHHTLFEMMGNFSFGDYFKEEAIHHAWQLLREEFALPADRLWITVHDTDDEARGLWRKIAGLADERIISIAGDDNFWSMGDTGPCGPCSEIFFDHGEAVAGGPPGSADAEGDRFVEIWNLVFMQYDRDAAGQRTLLPRPSIDTGMGLERIAAVLQGVHDNYAIDTFRRLIEAVGAATGTDPTNPTAAHRVIADHLRAACFLLADGVMPSNEGRGYVLRRIIRRAARHARGLGAQEPLLARLAPTLEREMGEAWPHLVASRGMIVSALDAEERRFMATLERGLGALEDALARLGSGERLDGATAFRLHDTYGFPLDITRDIAASRSVEVDAEGFAQEMAAQRARARASWRAQESDANAIAWAEALAADAAPTEFLGYQTLEAQARLEAIVADGKPLAALEEGARAEIAFNRTPFYAESGGQCGDIGTIEGADGALARVEDVIKRAGGTIHSHIVRGERGRFAVGDTARLLVDVRARARSSAHHSATHLLFAALKRSLGAEVSQKGSAVGFERLRFDFSWHEALSPQMVADIEDMVNEQVERDAPTQTRLMAPEDAVAEGASALFGEKYGSIARVLSIGAADDGKPYSLELCGGAHVARSGEVGLFRIVEESALAAGVRRIEACAGPAARAWTREREGALKETAALLRAPPARAAERVAALLADKRTMEQALREARARLAQGVAGDAPEAMGAHHWLGKVMEDTPQNELRAMVDAAKRTIGSGVVAFVGIGLGKAGIAVGVSEDLVGDGWDAREFVRAGVAAMGGSGGGGRADFAQGGGAQADKAQAALDAVRTMVLARV